MRYIDNKESSIILIGAGNMGEALLDGMLKKNLDVSVFTRTEEKAQKDVDDLIQEWRYR